VNSNPKDIGVDGYKYHDEILEDYKPDEEVQMRASNKNNVEKKMSANNDMSLAKDIKDIQFDFMQDLADSVREDYLKEKKEDQSFIDWLQTKPDEYFERLSFSSGGVNCHKVF
jgi:hypothetical protein